MASNLRVPGIRQHDHQRVYHADFQHDAVADFLEADSDYRFSPAANLSNNTSRNPTCEAA